jgi:hypothetical protein
MGSDKVGNRKWCQGSILRDRHLEEMNKLADLFNMSGIETRFSAYTEASVSFSAMRKLRRFPLEYLSMRKTPHDPLPLGYKSE